MLLSSFLYSFLRSFVRSSVPYPRFIREMAVCVRACVWYFLRPIDGSSAPATNLFGRRYHIYSSKRDIRPLRTILFGGLGLALRVGFWVWLGFGLGLGSV